MAIRKNIFKYIQIIIFILVCNLSANDKQYDELFYYLESKGIIVGEDVSNDDLFDMVSSGNIYLQNGEINKNKLEEKLKMLSDYKTSQYKKIHEKLEKNPNNKINKEISNYFKDNNDAIQKTQDDLSKKDNNGWFSSIINYILEFLKN